MRILIAFLILISCWAFGIAQEIRCPSVSVVGPSEISFPRRTERYTVRLDPDTAAALQFNWMTSTGMITSGQGTRSITVDKAESCLTVAVDIFGLPPNCPSSAGDSSCIDPAPVALLLATLGRLNSKAEQSILKAVEELYDYDRLCIIVYAKTTKTAAARVQRLKKVLQKDIGRVTFLRSASGKDEIKVFRVPPGATPPKPSM